MMRTPIRMRVALAFAAAMAVVLLGTGWFLYVRIGAELSTALDRELELRAYDLTAVVRDPDSSLAAAGGRRFVERGEAYAQLLDRRGRVLDATPPLDARAVLDPAELRAARRGTIFANVAALPGLDEPSRLLATPVVRGGRRLVLVVGATRENRTETLRRLRDELLIAGPVALVLATLAGYLLAGLSLRQVDSMRRRAASISAATPGERLPVPHTGDEIERLGETLNAMLARLEDGLERERGFVADAGHELRTPLALLRTELELALRHADSAEELRDAVRRSSVEVDRLAQLAEDLLLMAQSNAGRLALRLEPLEASDLLRSTASRFEWRAHDAGRAITFAPGTAVPLRGDRIRLEQAVGNLIDNALRHGGGDVELSATAVGETVELHVTDRGGGLPPEFVERAFERFSRPDPARGPGGGAGLGLSIVRMIAEAHGGTARVANRTGGGADVWVELPAGGPAAGQCDLTSLTCVDRNQYRFD
jgi:two-component system, OmpR family, sensor kinase